MSKSIGYIGNGDPDGNEDDNECNTSSNNFNYIECSDNSFNYIECNNSNSNNSNNSNNNNNNNNSNKNNNFEQEEIDYNRIKNIDYYTPKHSQLQLSRGRLYQGHQSLHIIYPNQNLNQSYESLNDRSINDSKEFDSSLQYDEDYDEDADHNDDEDLMDQESISHESSNGLDETDFENIDKYFENNQYQQEKEQQEQQEQQQQQQQQTVYNVDNSNNCKENKQEKINNNHDNSIVEENKIINNFSNLSLSVSSGSKIDNNDTIRNSLNISNNSGIIFNGSDPDKDNSNKDYNIDNNLINNNSNNDNLNGADLNNNSSNNIFLLNKTVQLFSNYENHQDDNQQNQHQNQNQNQNQKSNDIQKQEQNQPFLFFNTTNNSNSNNNLSSNSSELDLSEQELNEFPSFDEPFVKNYKIIDLSFNNISNIPLDSFEKISKLEQLIMFNNNLTYIPTTIETLRNLTILDLSHNRLEDTCREMGNLKSLRELYLSNNLLSRFPTTGNLINLKKLVLDNNKISTIPPECVEPLSQLQTLDLSFNKIEGIGSCIQRLKNLKQLNLSHNELIDIPNSLRHLVKLHSLSLDYNQISVLPDKIVASLPRLAKLTISNNKIKSLPYAINNLESLIELNASNNLMELLPEPICYLGNLKKLNLNNNNLKELPENIGFLTKLVDLQLYNNQITSLPISFLKCRSIREIGTDGNPLPSYYHLGIKAIRYHMKNPDVDLDYLNSNCDSNTISPLLNSQESNFSSSTPPLFDSNSSLNSTPATSNYIDTNPSNELSESLNKSLDLLNDSTPPLISIKKPLSSSSPSYPFININDDQQQQTIYSSNPRSHTETDINKQNTLTITNNNITLERSLSTGNIHLLNTSSNLPFNLIKTPPRIKYAWEIDYDELKFESLIGQGGFSKVYHGLWRSKDVAIKQIELQSNKSLDDFRREVGILSKLKPHDNLLAYYGACKSGNYCYIITEYLPRGSLHDLLHREKLIKLDFKQILSFAICVALGCYHLSTYEPPIYHTDLKTKNLLVTNNLKIKIADFGLASFAKRKDSYGVDQSRLAYAYYAAPEILNSKQFSEKSDVFSFGTILWELVTNNIPFDGMDPYDVKELLKSGKRLEIPENCHEVFKTTIQDCWNQSVEERPTFLNIYHRLENLMKSINRKKTKQ
ncbi:hypothetical protein DICPUDRAFT_147550 [Dictyostelium purpureum]|uniref:Protein kinase domain-containing protein n=1 Tax=Dictyostelium purpureum TaxID=5786 RepID=F0Z8S6_DICPU|nr:uncharacterized protein DICPUDRAFT_147550 [Dictyostelium purpureum]EGC39625.1 hypothetical protein DICPUDRAFT_147550 [Dictyostelium purpureum]|eukprot:XP_003283846.1 hypothetical protein DICPUDRAFT_147550 [Dictyostelium purpureum]